MFETVLLLLVAERPAHGSRLMAGVKRVGLELSDRTVYSALRRLEKRGLLDSEWEIHPSGPAWRVYHLTAAGGATLEDKAEALENLGRLLRRHLADHAAEHSDGSGAQGTAGSPAGPRERTE